MNPRIVPYGSLVIGWAIAEDSINMCISAVVGADRPLNTYKLAYHVKSLTELKADTKTGDSFARPSVPRSEQHCTASSERVKLQPPPLTEHMKTAGTFAQVRPQPSGLSARSLRPLRGWSHYRHIVPIRSLPWHQPTLNPTSLT